MFEYLNVFQIYDFILSSKPIPNSDSLLIVIWVCQFETLSSSARICSSIVNLLSFAFLLLRMDSDVEFRKSSQFPDWSRTISDGRCNVNFRLRNVQCARKSTCSSRWEGSNDTRTKILGHVCTKLWTKYDFKSRIRMLETEEMTHFSRGLWLPWSSSGRLSVQMRDTWEV